MNFKFKNKKKIHVSLLISIIVIQILIFVLWYNQSINEDVLSKKIEKIEKPNLGFAYSNKANEHFNSAQNYLNKYIQFHSYESLDQYHSEIKKMSNYFDSLCLFAQKEPVFFKLLQETKNLKIEIAKLKSKIDTASTINTEKLKKEFGNDYKIKEYEFQEVLSSINYDSVGFSEDFLKKGLFSRVADATSEKYNIKNEEVVIKMTMKYGKEFKSGSFEEQFNNFFDYTNAHYDKELDRVKKEYLGLNELNQDLVNINLNIQESSQFIINKYNAAALDLSKIYEKEFVRQYKSNTLIRNSSILSLIFLMVVITLILLGFTRMAFDYEKKLLKAQNEIVLNLNFKNRLIRMLSHEIRSPLSIIPIFCQEISSKIQEKDVKNLFSTLEFTSNSLIMLANQVLEYSKNQKKGVNLKNEKIKLNTELSLIIGSLEYLAKLKGNRIILSCEIDVERQILADKVKIHQLFYNLIGNSIKFTENGIIKVFIKENIQNEEYFLDVEIKDNGVGISNFDLKKIFDNFYQGKNNKSNFNMGVGLGLNLCKEIVELYNGEIHIESELSRGTSVFFRMKFKEFM